MPDPNQPNGSIPSQGTTPGLTPDELMAQQTANQQNLQAQNQLDTEKIQKAADAAAKKIFRKVQNTTIKPGVLINFEYNFYKHDFSPLCLVGKVWTVKNPGMVSGLNLHYLTFRYIKYLLNTFCGKNFHYGLIKGNRYIVNAYRSYKKEGRRNVKMVDCGFLNDTLKKARSFKPGELEAMRKEVQRQLKEKMHPNAEQLAKEWQEAIFKQSHKNYNTGRQAPDARFNPDNVLPPGTLPGQGQPGTPPPTGDQQGLE